MFNNNNGLYGAPSHKSPEHLQKHKDVLISPNTHAHSSPLHSHTHTRPYTHYEYMHYQNDRLVCRREEMGFQLWFKRRWRRMLHTERKRVPEHRSNVLKGSLPQGLSAHPRNMEDPSIWGWVKRVRRRVEMKQLREVWRSRTRDNVEADENYFALNPAADWKPVEIVKWRSDAGRFRIFADEVSCRVDHSDFYQLQGEPEESQQGEHYNDQAWREQERKQVLAVSKERYCRIKPIHPSHSIPHTSWSSIY